MKVETLRVVWKYIRWKGQGRTPMSYCSYIIQNKNHKHRLKVREGSPMFEILKETRIYKDKDKCEYELLVDGIYDKNNKLLYTTNYRKL